MTALGIDLFRHSPSPHSLSNNHKTNTQALPLNPTGKIEWHVYLLRSPLLPKLTKDSHYLITNLASFTHWITAVADLGKDQVNAGLQLKMESPDVVENQATAAESSSDSDHEVLPSVFESSINLYMEKLYKKHLPNKKYNIQFPVVINPCNPNCSILLTMGAVQTWACALNTGTPGMLINSPPASLQYLNLESKKQKNHLSSSSSEMGDILMQLLASKQKKSNTSDSDDSKEHGIQSDSHTIETSQEKLVSQFFLFSLALYITHVLLS
ncbi:uncharacterized protein VP01_3572g3 [Puccinia sorghi]|uniref:Uncharacterized protein n=1 Tax=Puccinia sorghi TaxID=27349 RepID=A0A0L6UV93_9BASI|nr:uncharacterized protein VP01_3572g3 [Puccinia sorghi]